MSKRKSTSRYEATRHEGVERDKRSGIFYIRDTIGGIWIDKSLKTKSITAAKDKADHIRAKFKLGQRDDVIKRRYTFREAFDQVELIQSTMSKKTQTMCRTQLKHLRRWFNKECVYLNKFEEDPEGIWAKYILAQQKRHHDIQYELSISRRIEFIIKDFETNIDEIRFIERSSRPRRLKHERRYLVMTLLRARKLGWIKKDYSCKDFPLNEAVTPIGKYIEDDQVRLILSRLVKHRETWLQFLLAIETGMRKTEILSLEREGINLKTREIDLDPNRIKTRRPRKVPIPIPDDVYPHLKLAVQVAMRNNWKYIFPKHRYSEQGRPIDGSDHKENNRYHWEQVKRLTGITVRWHDTRHTAIANMLMAGIPVSTVSKVVGATEETVTKIYDKVCGKMQDQLRGLFRGKFVELEVPEIKLLT